MAVADTAKLIAELTLDDKMSKGIKSATGSLGKLESSVGRVGKGAGQLSAGLARAGTKIGLAAVGGVAVATKAFIDWQDAFQGVVKTVDEADLNKAGLSFEDLSDGLRAMAREMPNTANELAGIAEQAGALGIAGKDILAFTKQVAILASTTNVSADEAATALGQMGTIIGLTADEFDNFAASLVDLGNKGASTEADILEIARRSGGAAKLMHIAKDATLGWAAAAANLGLNQELAGTALQNFFVKTRVAIANNGPALEKIADIAGMTAKEFKKAFKEDATGALEGFIKGLGKLSEGERIKAIQKLFGKNSGLTRLLLGLSGDVDNLTDSVDTSTQAWKDATAAQAEFEKRNATIKSALQRLRNNAMDVAITFGEGVAPAVGRAADKLSEFLKQDANRSEIKKLGADVGAAIDKIDWKEVLDGAKDFVDVLKVALDYAKRIFDAVNALPTPVKGAAAGLIGLNQLSGGLIGSGVGNIIGGLGGAITKGIASKVPGLGRLVAQPVFVTNWPVGGLGGGMPGAGGAASLPSIISLLPIAGIVAAATQAVTDEANRQGAQAGIQTKVDNPFAGGLFGGFTVLPSMLGVIQELLDVTKNPPTTPVHVDNAPKNRTGGPDDRTPFVKPPPGTVGTGSGPAGRREFNRSQATLAKNVTDVRDKVEAAKIAQVSATSDVQKTAAAVRDKVESAKVAQVSATGMGASRVVGSTDRASGNIVSAIHGIPAPIVNVNVTATTVTKSVTTQKRSGGGGTSRNKDRATPQ